MTERTCNLPVYVVGALSKTGQLFYNINITNEIPKDSINKSNELLYLALNKDPKLIYSLQFDADEFSIIHPSSVNNKLISKIRIGSAKEWLQLSQVIPYDTKGKRIYFDLINDKVNCGDDKYNVPGWEDKSNKFRPIDGEDKPRGHPNEYHNHPKSYDNNNVYWEWIFGSPINISQITIHSRTDCCTNRLGSFNLEFYDNKDKLICSTKLNGTLTNTFKYENSKLVIISGYYGLIKNSLLNSIYSIKFFGPIFPVIEDGVNTLRLNAITQSNNSTEQYLELDPFDFNNGDNGGTICFWFKGTSSLQNSKIFDFGKECYMKISSSIFNSGCLDFGPSNSYQFFQNYNNNWIHVAWVFEKRLSPNQYYLYLNGRCIYRKKGVFPDLTKVSNFYIGKSMYSDPNLNGYLTDFKIYQRSLSSNDVFVLYSLHPLKKTTDDYSKLEPTQLVNYKYNLIKDISNGLINLKNKQLLYLDFNPANIDNNGIIKNDYNIKVSAFGNFSLKNYNNALNFD
jgi:hypothetical protein